jgi:tetratricopeptide (TPR) repeat protein
MAAERSVLVAREVRARELVAGTPPAQIADAIVGQCGSSRIRAHRLALGIALADVVAQVRARYEADGRRVPRFSETLLSAYENGQKRPGPEYLHYLCATYQADPADLGFDGRCLCGHSHRQDRAAQPHQPGQIAGELRPLLAGLDTAPSATRPGGSADDDELRRMLIRQLTAPGSQMDSRFLGAVDRIRRRVDEALLGGTVSAAMIDRWEQSAAGYGRQYMSVPPLRLLCDVLLDLSDVRRGCQERQPLEFAERLGRLASQLAGLAGIGLLDLGDYRLARSFFRTARTAADETGDRQLRAWVSSREALVPLYYGDLAEAAGLASAAADLAGRHLCAAAVMAPVTEARARARIVAAGGGGRREELDRARASLDRAEDTLADLPADQGSDTALGYTARQLLFHTGDILVTLGDWQAAYRAFGRARQLYSGAEVLDCALVALGQARCLLASDEPGRAVSLGREILAGLPPEHRTELVLQVARALGRSAAARDAGLAGLADFRADLHGT